MKNRDVSATDVARAHSSHGRMLSQGLARAPGERARRSDILQRSQAGSAAYNSAWKKYMEATTAEEAAIKALTQAGFHFQR